MLPSQSNAIRSDPSTGGEKNMMMCGFKVELSVTLLSYSSCVCTVVYIYVFYMLMLSLKSGCVTRAASSEPNLVKSFGELFCLGFLKVFLILV